MIPQGTQFHGVAPNVPTKNLGSQQANSQRNVYTIEDFMSDSFSGTFINFGGGTSDVLGGDTVAWGVNPITQADHLGNIVIKSKCIVSKISVKWSSVDGYQAAAGGAQHAGHHRAGGCEAGGRGRGLQPSCSYLRGRGEDCLHRL